MSINPFWCTNHWFPVSHDWHKRSLLQVLFVVMLSDANEGEEVAENFDLSDSLSFFGDRSLINSLADVSEENKFFQYVCTPGGSLNGCEFDYGFSSWSQLVSNQKSETIIKSQRKRKQLDGEKSRAAIRMISDDYNETFDTQSWKSNVEPGTFRYVPNNGQYRLSKMVREERDWFTVRKKNAEKVTPTLQALYAQREFKILTKQDLELRNSANSDSEGRDIKRVGPRKSNEVNIGKQMNSALTKSASDLYMENIPSRLDVLENEIKRDKSVVRRTLDLDEGVKPHPARSKYRDQKPVKECFSNSSSANSTQGECSPKDGAVKKASGMIDKLRPLEKITPQQRALQCVKTERTTLHRSRMEMTSTAISVDRGSTKSVGHEPTNNEDLKPVQIKLISATSSGDDQSSEFTEHMENGKGDPTQCNLSKPKSKIVKERVKTITSSTSLTTTELYPTEFDYVTPEGEVCGTKAVLANRHSRGVKNKNSQCANLPDISGRRIQISVTSQRLL